MAYLASITVYPIKSLDGVSLSEATVLESGALKHDRKFAIVDKQGKFVNAKVNPQIHLLRTTFDSDFKTVSLQVKGSQKQTFKLDEQVNELETWLSDFFGFAVNLHSNTVTGFPDDTSASGPTVISTKTVETVASWFTGIDNQEMRSRFRANLEIADVTPFWEDQLFSKESEIVHFQIGDVLFTGINPCQRCIVPTRNSVTGETYPQFQKIFIEKRKQTLPNWVETSRFNHYYRLSVNTRIPEHQAGKILKLGDKVTVNSKQITG